MSTWGSWFGGGSAAKKDAPKKAILQLRSQLEMLSKREKHLQNQMDEQDAIARKNVNTNKAVAKAALRRKKQFEHANEQTSNQIMTLEREIYSIETANINKETLDAMKNASAAMKHIHGGLTVDKVDATMEELREQHAIGEEISEAIGQPVGQQIADEDELDAELEELQQEQLDEKMLKTGTLPVSDKVNRLPTVAQGESQSSPFSKPPRKKIPKHANSHSVKGKAPVNAEEEDEEEELRKLQAEMAM